MKAGEGGPADEQARCFLLRLGPWAVAVYCPSWSPVLAWVVCSGLPATPPALILSDLPLRASGHVNNHSITGHVVPPGPRRGSQFLL